LSTILLFANTAWYLYNYRLSLAEAIRDAGMTAVLVSPFDSYVDQLQSAGFEWRRLEVSRKGVNPVSETFALCRCVSLYREISPDLVHHFTVKPILYGSMAARMARVGAVVNSVTGLGFVFSSGSVRARVLRRLIRWPYRIALSGRHSRVIFQNDDDRRRLLAMGLVDWDRTAVIPGSGVDLQRFHPVPEPAGIPRAAIVSRMLWDKGVLELVEAARVLQTRGVPGRIVLVGGPDPGNPSSIPASQLEAWRSEGVVDWWGHRDDLATVYSDVNLIVLPTKYGEGVPRSLVEGAAAGRALVATDLPGCREVVVPGVTGILVPPGDPSALADALQELLQEPNLRRRMGQAARERAEAMFSAQRVNSETLSLYHSLLGRKAP
jgi:glycosyltransferase involved in cell wall biosynthesis